MSNERFKGKAAVVLGASAEGGSGWAIAKRLAAEGARVAVASRNLPELQRLASIIGGIAIRCDAGEPEDLKHLADKTKDTLGPIDIAIDAAGWPMPGNIADITVEKARQAIAVNFFGPLFFTQQCSRVMRDGGAITIISSLASTHICPGQIAYACAKAAANQMVRYAAIEFGPRKIRVNAVIPALIESKMSAPFRALPGVMEAVLKEVPLGRGATPEDMAAACLWLSSEECFATGVLFPVDGGNHLRRSSFPDEFPPNVWDSIGE
jgi:NAD(P)-dependent dehydrogenase (short-subunit alcohol dehydrogenase family)